MNVNKMQILKQKLTELFIASKMANSPLTPKNPPVTPIEPEE